MKKLISCMLLLLLFSLTACGENSASSEEPPTSEPETAPEPVSEPEPEVNALDLTGQWKEVSPESEDSYYGAVINGDKIELHWVCDDGGTRYLYWSGSYIPPETEEETYSWTSQVGQRRIDREAMAAGEGFIKFYYYNNQLSCNITKQGTERVLYMEQDEWEPGLGISNVPDELKSGFDLATNHEFTYDGITFSYPVYFTDQPDSYPDFPDSIVFNQPDNPNYHCFLEFNLINYEEGITEEEFYEIMRTRTSERKNGDEGLFDVKSNETVIAGRPAYLLDYKKFFLHDGLIFTTVRLAYIFNSQTGKETCFVKVYYGNGDMSGYDYAGDFQKILDSAQLAS